MNPKDISFCQELLRIHNYRITDKRVALLVFLKQSKKPHTAKEIQQETSLPLNKVTLYRALEDFVTSKIIKKVHLQNTITHYEFVTKDHHHHHIICEKCGAIEDIEHCEEISLQKKALSSSKKFNTINSHSLEFFGICKSCNKKYTC